MNCCPLCSYSTRFPSWLSRHLLRHQDAKPYACKCGIRFKTVSALNLHNKEIHSDTLYTCEICGFTCKQKRILDRHLLVHYEEKPIACDKCEYTCRRKQDLQIHMKCMHAGKPRRKRYEESIALFLGDLHLKYCREFVVKFQNVDANKKSARIDFCLPMSYGLCLLEVDELQHSNRGVDDECVRMARIWSEFARRNIGRIHVIRYNPNAWKQNGYVIKPTAEERHDRLKESLLFEPKSDFVITYLFYRLADDVPAITLSPDYTLREHVRSMRV